MYQNPFYGQYPAQNQMQMQMPSQPSIYGKMVDSVDVVKAMDVPFGTTAVFPKADQSEIYIKAWNADGTTKITTYSPTVTESTPKTEDVLGDIKKSIEELTKKIETITSRKKREVIEDDEY